VITAIIHRSVSIKAAVVQNDEKEKGERKILNLGHSFAHTIENLTGLSHGEAVSIGIVLAAGLSEKLGLLKKDDTERIRALSEIPNPACFASSEYGRRDII
jgi:3-dehydroquinate synthase